MKTGENRGQTTVSDHRRLLAVLFYLETVVCPRFSRFSPIQNRCVFDEQAV